MYAGYLLFFSSGVIVGIFDCIKFHREGRKYGLKVER